ncbi:sensor histidine kinase [Streptomyces sp. NPDC059003]|uniref:sensor histidine kinase n=1 Tax=Streptomyces sp. NPDC059003 TaxID=3346691 RepID=UPI0036B787E1
MLLVLVVTAQAVQEAALSAGRGYVTVPVAAAACAGLALAFRRRWPLAVAGVTVLVAGFWGPVSPLLVALFQLSARGRTGLAVAGAGVALAVNAWARPAVDLWALRSYGPLSLLALAVALGLWAGSRRRLVDALAARVESLRVERELGERAARLSERSAIAAEMHDVLAHRLSLIALHTGVLATRKDALPEPVGERLTLLRTAATDALADLRDVLGALRDPESEGSLGADAPAPVLRDVTELVEQARAAGQQVDAEILGDQTRAPAAHRLAVFRVVQEALANARKHAPDAAVRVRVDHGPPATLVEVVNGPGARPADAVPSGFGLVGLAERVTALGGELHAGPGGAGAWRLAARIPHPVSTPDQNATPT